MERRGAQREIAVAGDGGTVVLRGKVAVMVAFLLLHRQRLADSECGSVTFEYRHQRVTTVIGFRFPTEDADREAG